VERAAGHRRRGHPVRATAIAVAVYVALAVVCYWHLWAGGPASVVQSGGDQIQFVWDLNWLPYALGHGLNPFFTPYLNAPHGVNLLTNNSVPLLGLLTAPITVLWGPLASFNVLETAAFAGSATSMYVVACRFTSWRPAAFVAGLLYGFSPYQIGQGLGHLNLTFCVLPPIILLLVHDIAAGRPGSTVRRGVLLGLMVVGQFFISAEVLATTAVMAVVLLAVMAVRGRHQLVHRLADVVRGLGSAAIVAGTVLAYPIWFALAGPQHVNGPLQDAALFRADLLGPVVPDSLMRLAPSALATTADVFSQGVVENGSYLGITLLLVLGVGAVVFRHRAVVQATVVLGVVAFVLSLGPRLVVTGAPGQTPSGAPNGWPVPLPGALLARLPVLDHALSTRFSLYSAMAAALLLAVILDRSHRSARRTGGVAAGIVVPSALAVFALFPLVPAVPYGGIAAPVVPVFFRSPAVAMVPAGRAAVLYPYPSAVVADPELWQVAADLRFRMPGGYDLVPAPGTGTVSTSPLTPDTRTTAVGQVLTELYVDRVPPRTTAIRAAVRAELAAWHVTRLVAVPLPSQRNAVRSYLSWLVGRAPRRRADAYVWYTERATPVPSPLH